MNRQQFAQKAFVVRNDEVLVVKKSSADPHNPDRWEMPGGRMEFGETVDDHIAREVMEETGYLIRPGSPFHIWQWTMEDLKSGSDDMIQVIAVARRCTLAQLEQSDTNLEDTDFIAGHEWIPIGQLLATNLIPSLRPAAEAFIAGHGGPE
jgi:8-oxo-dGTP pyrophosphatase MutT (NUDIX family)